MNCKKSRKNNINFGREVSKSLVSKTFVQKRRQKSSGSPSPLLVKRTSVSPSVRKDQSAHQPDRTTRRRCAHCSTKEMEVRTD
ncbi:piggyBac transposable element-derived protein 4-like [Aphis craccivora]|uniref:PiggyBac transposable element-derived protein 4-like n=1 Tax=Aphis craccivora TaxID=307492 RepID=A0A6G0WKK3_APHCR|nr:piggyBac transposable element-derived protein 4-like [Aphis craccivora]